MKILFIIGLITIIIFAIKFINKRKKSMELDTNASNDYSEEAIEILKKYFGDKNFYQNSNFLAFKNKLEIKTSHKKELEIIIKNALHKIEIHYNFSINSNKPYTDFTKLKLSANEVLDYAVKNNIKIKKSIVLMFLLINNDLIKEKLDEDFDENIMLESFHKMLPEFIVKYNKKLNN